jgi:GT2 family glycosyltransferase
MDDPSNSTVGICGVQLIDDDGAITRSCARFPAALVFALSALGLNRLFPRLGVLMEDWAHDDSRDVDHVIGAFYLVRRDVFEVLGGFDENFFVYLEDLDFSLRARHLGWRCHYLSDARAFHLGGGSSRQVKDRRLFYSLRSRVIYSFKHHGFSLGSLILFMTAVVEPVVRSAWSLGRLSLSSLSDTLKAYWLFWFWLPRWAIRGITR